VEPLPSPRSAKGKSTQRTLIDAARVILARDGYLEARVSDISAEAGLSYGAFYRYFSDKQQIMLHVIAEFLETSRTTIRAPFDPEDPSASVRITTQRYLEYWAANAELWQAVLQATKVDAAIGEVHQRAYDGWCERIGRMLRLAADHGVGRADLDTAVAGHLLGAMVEAYAQRAFRPDSGLETDPATVAEEITKLWVGGVFVAAVSTTASSAHR
jgi:AcrR family transcriptional regulator